MHKTPYVHSIVGGRSVKLLKENIEALGLELSDADIDDIEEAIPFNIGFPHNLAAWGKIADRNGAIGGGDIWLVKMVGHFDFVSGDRSRMAYTRLISRARSSVAREANTLLRIDFGRFTYGVHQRIETLE